MEATQEFLRRLCRFNEEVRQIDGRIAAQSPATRERFAACEDAERDLRDAFGRREEAERALRSAERFVEEARSQWREAELDERIARANTEAQVWAFIAQSDEPIHLRSIWEERSVAKPTWQAPTNRPSLANRFFSVARVHDDTYRFFTISHG